MSFTDPRAIVLIFDRLSDDAWLDQNDLAALYRTHPSTVKGWRQRGVGPDFIRTSATTVRYSVRAVRAHMAKLQAEAAA